MPPSRVRLPPSPPLTYSPFGGRIGGLASRTMRVPAPPSYPRHPETRLRHPEAGFLLGSRLVEPINVWDYERLAEQRLDANALAYFAGGAGDEVTLRGNLAAFQRRKLRPRILVVVSSVTTATTGLGHDV